MTEPYLIAHKVRGQPAFDIAHQIPCPECNAEGCNECDSTGHWWIIPTSGHRAYPYWFTELSWLATWDMPNPPADLPDHYPTRATPTISLAEALGLLKPKPKDTSSPFPRRL